MSQPSDDAASQYLCCDERNIATGRVAEKCGYQRDGLFRLSERDYTWEIVSRMHYAMLKDDYAQLQDKGESG